MKIIFKNILLLGLLCFATTSFCQNIIWTAKKDWEQIKLQAKIENKLIFVDCMATWCLPCKKMDDEVYNQPKVYDMINVNFISLKLQMDSTSNDNEAVRNLREFAKATAERYGVRAFPTYLFFSPEGNLVYHDTGAKVVNDFLAVSNKALDEGRIYAIQLLDWNRGRKDYTLAPSMILRAERLNDKSLASSIARDCIVNYVNRVEGKALYNADILRAVGPYILPEDKKLLTLFYPEANGNLTDSLINHKGTSRAIIRSVMSKDLNARLFEDNDLRKPKIKNPNWNQIKAEFSERYGSSRTEELLLNTKKAWYQISEPDWEILSDLYFLDIEKNYISRETFNPSGVNDMLWEIFLNVDNKRILRRAAALQLLAIKQAKIQNGKIIETYIDTYAALLYRSGNRQEAIKWQEKAIEARKEKEAKRGDEEPFLGFIKTLEKMKKGEPIWLRVE